MLSEYRPLPSMLILTPRSCRTYWGSYKADGKSLTIAGLSWTEAGCPGPGLFDQESAMKDILVGTQRGSSSDSRLTIEGADGRALVFER